MSSAPKTLRLILGDQLNAAHSWFQQPDDRGVCVLMEVRQETDTVTHHIQKVAAFFAAMRAFGDHLRRSGHAVIYLRLDDPGNRHSIPANIRSLLKKHRFTGFEYLLPDEHRLELQLRALAQSLPVPARGLDTEHFLTERLALKEMFSGKSRFLMESFYRRMRKRFNVLMEGEKPAGGRWNFDAKNRGAYDGRTPVPKPLVFDNDVREIVAMLRKAGVKTCGEIDPQRLIWPVTRSQALALLEAFIADGLPWFGTYQDAMTLGSWSLFHSRLSFALNAKILHPMEVIGAAVDAWRKNPKRDRHPAGGGVRAADPRLARIHARGLLGADAALCGDEPSRPRPAAAGLLLDGRDRHALPAVGDRPVARPRLRPPHPAADGDGQLRAAGRHPPGCGGRLVSRHLHRCRPVGGNRRTPAP